MRMSNNSFAGKNTKQLKLSLFGWLGTFVKKMEIYTENGETAVLTMNSKCMENLIHLFFLYF